jgi:hypothetical protein
MLRTSRISIVPTNVTAKASYGMLLLLSDYGFLLIVRNAATAAAASSAAHLAQPTKLGPM